MTIQGGKVYDILRTYNKQIKYSKLSSSEKSNSEKSLDKVTISDNAKKLSFLSNLLADLGRSDEEAIKKVNELLKDVDFKKISEKELEDIKKEIIEKLS
jgi:hypothetical protein